MSEFDEIYRQYFDDVYRYIRRLSGDEHIAEEITSETFFKALQTIGKFRGECDIRVWLCQIAKNSYYSYLKKTSRSGAWEDSLLDFIDSDVSAEEAVMHREDAMMIRKILHDVPEPYKEVFMWRVFAEMSFSQIGQIFSKSENWACVTYHRARKMITERLEEEK